MIPALRSGLRDLSTIHMYAALGRYGTFIGINAFALRIISWPLPEMLSDSSWLIAARFYKCFIWQCIQSHTRAYPLWEDKRVPDWQSYAFRNICSRLYPVHDSSGMASKCFSFQKREENINLFYWKWERAGCQFSSVTREKLQFTIIEDKCFWCISIVSHRSAITSLCTYNHSHKFN